MLPSSFWQNRDIYFKKVALLLTHLGDRSIPRKTLTLVGNPVVSTLVSKFGKGSWYFNGNTCTIQSPSLELLNRSFSIEFWILLSENASTIQVIATTYNISGAQVGTFILYRHTNNTISVNSAFGPIVTSSPLLLNQWYFVRMTYKHSPSPSTTSLFINNVLQGTGNISITAQANKFHVGGSQGDGNLFNQWFKGYLESFRVTLDITRNEKVPQKLFPYS